VSPLARKRRLSILKHELEADEAAVIVQTHGRPPLLVNGPASVRTFWRWRRIILVDLKQLTLHISLDHVATKDGVRLGVRVTFSARVVSPLDAATTVVDYSRATCQITEATLRGIFGECRSTDLAERLTEIEAELRRTVASAAESWGVSVSAVQIQLVE
jgi:regulator of protease activity HflC (stomatin/prohibitin superfamily)